MICIIKIFLKSKNKISKNSVVVKRKTKLLKKKFFLDKIKIYKVIKQILKINYTKKLRTKKVNNLNFNRIVHPCYLTIFTKILT